MPDTLRPGPLTRGCVWLARVVLGGEGIAKLLLIAIPRYNPGILAAAGAEVGHGCVIHSPLLLMNADGGCHHLRIGRDCHLGKGVLIDLAERVRLGDRVTVSMRVTIASHRDLGASVLGRQVLPRRARPVIVEDDVYVGAGAVILDGVTIGRRAVVGAGAVVVRDVDPQTVVGGVPATLIRRLDLE